MQHEPRERYPLEWPYQKSIWCCGTSHSSSFGWSMFWGSTITHKKRAKMFETTERIICISLLKQQITMIHDVECSVQMIVAESDQPQHGILQLAPNWRNIPRPNRFWGHSILTWSIPQKILETTFGGSSILCFACFLNFTWFILNKFVGNNSCQNIAFGDEKTKCLGFQLRFGWVIFTYLKCHFGIKPKCTFHESRLESGCQLRIFVSRIKAGVGGSESLES